jgi:adenosylcobinamide-phosphate synthase
VGEPADAPFLDGVVGLVWRALVVWLFLLLLLALASALPF